MRKLIYHLVVSTTLVIGYVFMLWIFLMALAGFFSVAVHLTFATIDDPSLVTISADITFLAFGVLVATRKRVRLAAKEVWTQLFFNL